MFGEEQGFTISMALGMKVGFVAGDTAFIQGPLSQLLRAGLCFDRRAECNADSCFNFQPDADITHKEPKTQKREEHWTVALKPCRVDQRGQQKPAGHWGPRYPERLRIIRPGRGTHFSRRQLSESYR